MIYQFNKKTKEYIYNSLKFVNKEDNKKNIINLKGYLIKKEWLDTFKIIYSYNKISEYLQKKGILEIGENNEKINELIDDIIKNVKIEFSKDVIINQKLKEESIINFSLSDLSKLENENNIYYPEKFYIINKEIYKKLCEIKLLKKDEKKEIIIL